MSKMIGIVREWKTACERRAPITPMDVADLMAQSSLEFSVEPSPHRVFDNSTYESAGAKLTDDLSPCDFFIGIKEMPMDRLHPGKPHLFFSHTIKGQEYNIPLLRKILELKCTLLDYELVKNDDGNRLIFFGRQAGQAGMLNTLWALGQRLEVHGLKSPFANLKQARFYEDLSEGLEEVAMVRAAIESGGLPDLLQPFVCGITGTGNVAAGAGEVLAALNPLEITVSELEAGVALENPHRIHLVVFDEEHLYRRQDGGKFIREDFRQNPEGYESALEDHLDNITMLVTGHFWDARYPKIISKDSVASMFERNDMPRLQVIGDVSCDPEGGIEVTLKATYPDNPCFVYHPDSRTMTDGFDGEGLLIMAVEILPTELANDSSRVFSAALKQFLPAVLDADFGRDFKTLDLPPEFKRAVIAHQGSLTPDWAHLLK